MRSVFGIDVSKSSSEVAILINGEKVHGYTMSNDAIGFARLLGDLKAVHQPEIIFEATGVYSRRLQAFLEDNGYAYTRLNPLEAKKQLDSLRVRKTDKIDAFIGIDLIETLRIWELSCQGTHHQTWQSLR